eukprot:81824-Pyramimonas_sp.AAC.1
MKKRRTRTGRWGRGGVTLPKTAPKALTKTPRPPLPPRLKPSWARTGVSCSSLWARRICRRRR